MFHPTALYDEISCCKILLSFAAFALPRKFLWTFSKAFQAILSVTFNFVLEAWSSKICLIC